jgi:hypothetical protein
VDEIYTFAAIFKSGLFDVINFRRPSISSLGVNPGKLET